jgi:hypothetical protein
LTVTTGGGGSGQELLDAAGPEGLPDRLRPLGQQTAIRLPVFAQA